MRTGRRATLTASDRLARIADEPFSTPITHYLLEEGMLQRIAACSLAVALGTTSISGQSPKLRSEDLRWFLFVGQRVQVETASGWRHGETVDAIYPDAFRLVSTNQSVEILYAKVVALRDPATGRVIQVEHHRGSRVGKIVAVAGLAAAGAALFCALVCPR